VTVQIPQRIEAPADLVYRLASEVELWPALARQIRSVRVLRRSPADARVRLIEVHGRQGWLPFGWRSIQRLDPAAGRMTLRQVSSMTSGSVAEWSIVPSVDGRATDVHIVQSPRLLIPVFGRVLAERIAGPLIGRPFAESILRDLKHVAEGGSLAGRR